MQYLVSINSPCRRACTVSRLDLRMRTDEALQTDCDVNESNWLVKDCLVELLSAFWKSVVNSSTEQCGRDEIKVGAKKVLIVLNGDKFNQLGCMQGLGVRRFPKTYQLHNNLLALVHESRHTILWTRRANQRVDALWI